MRPLYLARIEDLGRGDLVVPGRHHVALLTPDFLLRLRAAMLGMLGGAVAAVTLIETFARAWR